MWRDCVFMCIFMNAYIYFVQPSPVTRTTRVAHETTTSRRTAVSRNSGRVNLFSIRRATTISGSIAR